MQTAPGAPLSGPTHVPQPARGRLLAVLVVVAVVVYAVDQVTKALAVDRLQPGTSVPLVGDLLQLQLTRNAGAAFSLATGLTWVLSLVAATVVVVVLRSARRLGSGGWAFTLGLLLGGALGNLTDRLLRDPGLGRGHVVDFIDYSGAFIGNVADIAIVGAALLVGVLALRGVRLDGRRGAPAHDPQEPGDG